MNALPLIVTDLSVSLDGVRLLHGVSFAADAGERLGFIGGSGSGKTLTALAIAGLLPEHAQVSGSIQLGERELVGLSDRQFARLRGDAVGMVFQEPRTALNPMRRLGRQMTEALAHHFQVSRSERREAALRLARRVGLSDPERIVSAYPHEVSGGQRQRAAIAAAISAGPGLLLADEPTTALDATVQQNILDMLYTITEGDETSLIFITHDLAVMQRIAERVVVFDAGRVVEHGTRAEILHAPQHEVTRALIEASRVRRVADD